MVNVLYKCVLFNCYISNLIMMVKKKILRVKIIVIINEYICISIYIFFFSFNGKIIMESVDYVEIFGINYVIMNLVGNIL